ncbi:hypothetical protein [Plantibacter sp. ME-Dv--P-122b]|uniref:hypothetical protein n=1 Tax=Plantibacter sp. ME-Dv--P-122b TaxID=3040300 RepID=UPI00254D055F|nr:hypothetical protein [Plantibacter sp. ME-Dv--P-122b]
MTITNSTPGLGAFQRSIRAEVPELVEDLRGILGAQLLAYLGNVRETRAVRQWAEGTRVPSAATELRLRTALQVAGILLERDHPRIAQSWFQGLNPQLDDESPARLIREGDIDEVGPRVIAAARAFTAVG